MTDPAFNPPRHIAIEGPIRVGKSTLAKSLAEQLHARRIFDAEDNPFPRGFLQRRTRLRIPRPNVFSVRALSPPASHSLEDNPAPIVSDFLFEKDKIFAYLNLDNEELKLYERYFEMLAPSIPAPRSGHLSASQARSPAQTCLEKRRSSRNANFTGISWKPSPTPTNISSSAIQPRTCLVVDTSEIDFVERNQDLQELLRRLRQPVKGTQYFLPLGQGRLIAKSPVSSQVIVFDRIHVSLRDEMSLPPLG